MIVEFLKLQSISVHSRNLYVLRTLSEPRRLLFRLKPATVALVPFDRGPPLKRATHNGRPFSLRFPAVQEPPKPPPDVQYPLEGDKILTIPGFVRSVLLPLTRDGVHSECPFVATGHFAFVYGSRNVLSTPVGRYFCNSYLSLNRRFREHGPGTVARVFFSQGRMLGYLFDLPFFDGSDGSSFI